MEMPSGAGTQGAGRVEPAWGRGSPANKLQGFVACGKEFGFYSYCDRKPLEKDLVKFTFEKIHSGCYLGNCVLGSWDRSKGTLGGQSRDPGSLDEGKSFLPSWLYSRWLSDSELSY